MRIVELSGPIEDGMWSYDDPYPTPRVTQIPPPAWLDYPVYSQTVSLAVQAGTYLETAAHMDPTRMTIDQLPLERCYAVDALALLIPRGAGEAITPAALDAALAATGETLRPGDALLVGTGWDSHWRQPDFVTNPPYFTAAAIDWVLDHQAGLLGADTPRFDSPHNPQNFFPKFFQHDILLLAPVVNLGQVRAARGKLTALPLQIKDACASPVRALWIEE
ncbi:MAG: cyclase family protein [Caldilineaceae bacterium]|nr:cyclase family protein [Caldilineaceae bacterium]